MLNSSPPKAHNVIEELPKASANKFPKWESDIEPVDLGCQSVLRNMSSRLVKVAHKT